MAQGALFEGYLYEPNSEEVRTSLLDRGFAPVPLAAGKVACSEIFDDFSNFVDLCTLPGGDKLSNAVTFNVNDKGNGAFQFVYRVPGQVNPNEPDRAPGKDHKYILHYGSQSRERAKAALGGVLPSELDGFFDKCEDMYYATRAAALVGAKALGLAGVVSSGDSQDDVIHLRLIDYRATDEPILGEAHFDRSLFTVADSESSSGLRGVPGQNGVLEPVTEDYVEDLRNRLAPISHSEYEGKFFLGAGANRLLSPERQKLDGLPLLGHDIVNDHPGEIRRSVVTFVNPHNRYNGGFVVPNKYETGFDDIIEGIRLAA